MVDRFIRWGGRAFSSDAWHRAGGQPILYLFLWAAATRLLFLDSWGIRIDMVLHGTYVDEVWLGLSLVCPPLALLSWLLIVRCRWHKASLVGLWLRLGADAGQLSALVVFHLVSVRTAMLSNSEAQIYFRYLTASAIAFTALLVVRDIWAIVATERIAGRLRRA